MSNTYRGYGLTPDGTATPISDPGAYQRGEVVEMAADAQRLGGKPPSAYTAANLLDNSDFSNLVAQTGLVGTHGGTTYLGDRWIASGQITAIQQADHCSITRGSARARLQQNVPGSWAGKRLTFAAKCRCSDTVYLEFCNWAGTRISNKSFRAVDGIICYSITVPEDTTELAVLMHLSYNDNTVPTDVFWMALYEGSYTADTLPPYVAPDQSAELLKCQRRYRVYETSTERPSKPLDCSPPMILAPGTTEITQGTITVNDQTLYYNSTDL